MTDISAGHDTIVALATPEGRSALGVVRLSGPFSWKIAASCTRTPEKILEAAPKSAVLTVLTTSAGNSIDQVVVLPWRGPSSYTGEDLVEFICHGSPETLRQVVDRLIEAGCTPAPPGEFSKRAFLNGKMTLDQAEAVMTLIESRSTAASRAAMRILEGGLGNKIQTFQNQLVRLLGLVELDLDFVEEEINLLPDDTAAREIQTLIDQINTLRDQHRAGRLIRNGATVVIAGAPNAGKSTLLNQFAGYDRAIVSETPGTTRDYLDVMIDWETLPVRIVDTAGIRSTGDAIELEGTKRAERLFDHADAILWLYALPDAVMPPESIARDERLFLIENKSDLGLTGESITPFAHISAKEGTGISDLIDRLTSELLHNVDPSDILITEERHAELLKRATDSLYRALAISEGDMDTILVATELRDASNILGEITGRITTDDILNRVFNNFCIGK